MSGAYYDAVAALQYSVLLKKNRVLMCESYSGRCDSYEIPAAVRNGIIANISVGNENGVLESLDELYEINIECRRLSYEMIKCFLVELSDIFEMAVREYAPELCGENSLALKVLGAARIYETKEIFTNLTEVLCCRINSTKKDKLEELVGKIEQYIDEYYADENINVFAVANVMGMTRGYISRIFRQYTGMSILDAIHKRRIAEAMRLLERGESVNDIAGKIGYVNANVFTRSFKKYTGMTPSTYRDKIDMHITEQ